MEKSTLVEIIRACSKKELRDIKRWLLSPAHNQRKDAIQLFDYLTDSLNQTTDALLKEKVWSKLNPGETYDDARMRQVMYFLLSNIEDCLAYAELNTDPMSAELALARVYRRRFLEKSFNQKLEATRKKQEASKIRNSVYLRNKFYLEQENYYHLVGLKRAGLLNLQETSDALDTAFIAEKLRIGCHLISHQGVFKKITYDTGILETTIEYVEKANLTSVPAIAVYYYGFKALTDRENETHFDNLVKILEAHGEHFPVSELREVYLLAINYCINRINAGKSSFIRQSFELFKKGFDMAILLEDGMISRFTFGNAVQSALKSREFEWAENFISNFQHNLEEKYRKSIVHFNQSRLYFEKGDYDKAQRLLIQFEYPDMLQNISAKTMLLKIYFEQDELDAFESLLESMRTYLQRKEALDPGRKAAYKNMISLMKKLLHLNPYSKTQVEKLRDLVQETNPLLERDWLLKQLDGRK